MSAWPATALCVSYTEGFFFPFFSVPFFPWSNGWSRSRYVVNAWEGTRWPCQPHRSSYEPASWDKRGREPPLVFSSSLAFSSSSSSLTQTTTATATTTTQTFFGSRETSLATGIDEQSAPQQRKYSFTIARRPIAQAPIILSEQQTRTSLPPRSQHALHVPCCWRCLPCRRGFGPAGSWFACGCLLLLRRSEERD